MDEDKQSEIQTEVCPRATEWARDAFADDVVYLLNEVAMSTRQASIEALEPLGISPRQMAILRLLSIRSPIRQHELGLLLGIDRTSMVTLIDGLEGLGYVIREPAPNDRRAYALRLTEAGKAFGVDVQSVLDRVQSHILAPINDGERELLIAILGKLIAARRNH